MAHQNARDPFLIRFDSLEMLDLGGPQIRQDGVHLGLGSVGFELDDEFAEFVGPGNIISPGGYRWKEKK
jgi:hypothetical protein